MVDKEFEESDPLEMVGVQIPIQGDKHIVEMAETFIEEYLRMSWPEDMILGLFKLPFYRGPYFAYRVLGEERVRNMISEAKARISSRRV